MGPGPDNRRGKPRQNFLDASLATTAELSRIYYDSKSSQARRGSPYES